MNLISIIKQLPILPKLTPNLHKSTLILDKNSNKILKLAKSASQISQNLPTIINNSLSQHNIQPSILSIQTKDNQTHSIILLKQNSNIDAYELNDFIQNYNAKISNLINNQ